MSVDGLTCERANLSDFRSQMRGSSSTAHLGSSGLGELKAAGYLGSPRLVVLGEPR